MVANSVTKSAVDLENRCKICGKPLTRQAGDIGKTCKDHEGKIRKTAKVADAIPQGFLLMSDVCRKANTVGISTSRVVKACGGDACTEPVLDKVFEVTYVKSRKYLHPDVISKGFALLKKAAEEKPAQKEKAELIPQA